MSDFRFPKPGTLLRLKATWHQLFKGRRRGDIIMVVYHDYNVHNYGATGGISLFALQCEGEILEFNFPVDELFPWRTLRKRFNLAFEQINTRDLLCTNI